MINDLKIFMISLCNCEWFYKIYNNDESGNYLCKCCGNPLFTSSSKFDSGTGWPSFYNALDDTITTKEDLSYGMKRVEISCRNCNAHLGHVFPDGPRPTGLRYCVNSLSLSFNENE